MGLKTTTDQHKAFRDDCITVLSKHAGHLSKAEMLALAAHLVGQLIALQDQRTMTRERALETVMGNIEQGNAEVLANLRDKTEGHA